MVRKAALIRKREAVLERWFQAVLATYPEEAARFFGSEKDRFHNPVGKTLREGIARIYEGLIEDLTPNDLGPAIDTIVRIRAVQEFTPSSAVGFLFDLKGILREELAGAGLSPADWAALDAGVDRLALLAFDIYMLCREKLFEIRVREIKDYQLIAARAGGCATAACGGAQTQARGGR